MRATPILWTYFKTKSNLYPVKIRITEGEQSKYHSLDILIEKSQWDSKNKRVKNHIHQQDYNIKILDALSSFEKRAPVKIDFYWWFEEYLSHCKAKHSSLHVKKMTTAYNKIKLFKPSISAKDIDENLLMRYETWLRNKNYHTNYVADHFKRIRSIVKLMVKSGALEYHKDPFLRFKIKTIKTKKERLSFEDIQKLESAELTDNTALARDMYICSFYGGGIRFGDLCRINKSNFLNGRLRYTMNKTSNEKNIKLTPEAIDIWKKYNYQFPLKIRPGKEYQDISSYNAYLNKMLKEACKVAKVPEISFHTARHSIADHAVKNKVSSKGLQGILGHGKLATTEIYLRSFYQEESDQAMDQLFEK